MPSEVFWEPEPAARRGSTPARLRRALSGDLDAIVLKALQEEPGKRYGSAEQLAEDLRRHQESWPVRARRSTVSYRAAKLVRRHRLGVAALALVSLSLCAGIGATTWQARRAEAERRGAEIQQRRAEAVTTFLEGLFQAADPGFTKNPDLTLRSFLDDAARQVPAGLAHQPEIQGRLLNILGEGYRRLGLYRESREILGQALRIRSEVFGGDHPAVAESLNSLGLVSLEMGRLEEAEELVRQSLGKYRRIYGSRHPEVAETLNSLGLVLRQRGDDEAAEALFRQSLDQRREFLGEPQREVSVSLNNLGLLLQEQGQPERARPLLEEALAQQLELYGERHWLVALSRQNLALVLVDLGLRDAAAEQYRQALELYRELLGADHPRVAAVLHNYGDLLGRTGDLESARIHLHQAIAINEGRGESTALASNLMLLGILHYRGGSLAEAEAALGRSLELRRDRLGVEHPLYADALYSLTTVFREGGALHRAEGPLRQALAAWEATPPVREWDLPYARGLLGEVLLSAGHEEEGRSWLREGRSGLVAAGRQDLAAAFGDLSEE